MPSTIEVTLWADVGIVQPKQEQFGGWTMGDGTDIGAIVEIRANAVIGADCRTSSQIDTRPLADLPKELSMLSRVYARRRIKEYR